MKFTSSQVELTFNHAHRPDKGSKSFDINKLNTTSGVSISNTFRGSFNVWVLSWSNMSRRERDFLESFFVSVGGMAKTFLWTWSNGTSKTVRFNTPSIVSVEKNGGTFEVQVELME